MTQTIHIEPLSEQAFRPFGDVIETSGAPSMMINQGMCERYHDIPSLDFQNGRAGISLFHGQPYDLPLKLALMERHPLGSQAFIPMSPDPFLVIVAEDQNGPHNIRAFLTNGTQGVNYARNIWHGVLTPLNGPRLFAVIDRIGDGNNLEEHHFDTPPTITP